MFKYFASVRRTPSALVFVNRSLPAKSQLRINQQYGVKYIYLRDWSKQSIRPLPHKRVFVWTRIRFDAFSLVVHTKTTAKMLLKTEASRKRFQKWSALATHRFENIPFLVWTNENGSFWKRWRKLNASYTVVFISVFGRYTVDDRRKGFAKYAFSYENELMSTSESKTKTLVW